MSGPATVVESDEAMAVAIQERYRQEFLQRQSRKNRNPAHASPSRNSATTLSPGRSRTRVAPLGSIAGVDAEAERKRQEEADAALARRLAEEESGTFEDEPLPATRAPPRTSRTTSSGGLTEDERLARRLHEAELMRRFGGVTGPPPPSRPTVVNHGSSPFVASLYGSGIDPDEAAARRVAQEMEDEEIARRYNQRERDAEARRQAILVQNEAERKRRRRRCFVLPLICVLIAVGIITLFATGILDREKLPEFDGLDWIDNDPFDGDVDIQNPNATYSWKNNGNGLRLPMLNALDDSYQIVYATAVQNWENGDPKSLSLPSERIPYEEECSAVEGKLKVCNANYGNTRWRGLNEVLHSGRTIFSSTAKMNDYYLKEGPDGQRLYTTCHEIGHGFGLPHWDENFYNKDLGNCMDYTDEPEKNATPDQSNFDFLAEVYGTFNRRRLRGLPKATLRQEVTSFPEWLMDEYQVARQELEIMLSSDDNENRGGWRHLESLSGLESHERNLGGGYTLKVHLLLA